MYGIRTVLTKLLEANRENECSTICTDSWSALLSLKSRAGVSPMAEEIEAIIPYAGTENLRISLCLVPRHVGVVENEKADVATKEAAIIVSNPTLSRAVPIPTWKGKSEKPQEVDSRANCSLLDWESRKLKEI